MTERKVFTSDENFIICNIFDVDRSDYVELHRQLNGETSLYLNPISKDMMWEQILDKADSVFSLFTGKVNYFLIRISSNNPHSKYVFEKMGAIKIREETDFSRFVKRFCKLEPNTFL